MHTSDIDVQGLKKSSTQFLQPKNVSRHTMSSREIADLVEARHNDVIATIERLFTKGLLRSARKTRKEATGGRPTDVYDLVERDTHLVIAGYSDEHRARVIDRWQELETLVARSVAMPSYAEALRLYADQIEQTAVLLIENREQATKIHSMENLFKEGMTHTQFCKGLNGVNVMQVGKFLEGRNWLFNESKSGLRFRVASYARDKYMTEHQHEVTPHGKEPFVSFTPVLLKKGAGRLYDLYLAGELPMKKTWDGMFTHDKALRGAE
jgi:phage regulator Rha-like protein